jgi:general stress protein CsbA
LFKKELFEGFHNGSYWALPGISLIKEVSGQMVDKILAALFLPGILVVFFTRVTFNQIIGLILTVALIVASVYKGYTHTWTLFIIDAASLTAGYYFSNLMMARIKQKEKKDSKGA